MAITMKNLNDRIATLEGKATTTPITMKSLYDRLTALEAKGEYALIDLTASNSSNTRSVNFGTIPEKYRSGYNFLVCDFSGITWGSRYDLTFNKSNNTGNLYLPDSNWTGVGFNFNFSLNGTNIVLNGSGDSFVKFSTSGAKIKVLFYK